MSEKATASATARMSVPWFFAFIVLKFMGIAWDWSWWWILMPIVPDLWILFDRLLR